MLFSETGFYYSFYEDVVAADTIGEAFDVLLRDNRSEHPDTINALGRFNIYPGLFFCFVFALLKKSKIKFKNLLILYLNI